MARLGRLGRWLLRMTVQGMIPVIGGCAEALVRHYAGPGSTGLGKGVGDGLERGLNYFGLKIVGKWTEELPQESTADQSVAFQELGQASPQEIRDEAKQLLEEIHLEYAEADLNLALDYLTAIPQAIGRSLVADLHTGTKSLAKPVNPSQPQSLLQLLPADIPPYPSHGNLAGTPYVLEELVGMGGFGAVYRASAQSLQYLNFAIKFCLDRSVADALKNERANLERLIEAGSDAWSNRIIRLFGHGLDHQTPFLVYEYVPGGDLCQRLQTYASQSLLPTHDVVLGWIKEITQGLAFAHSRGLVHRDLKPANILVHNNHLKLADFGIGGVVAGQAIEKSQIGTLTPHSLPFAEQVSLYRGAGTPLYMSPEQRRGDAPDPKHDIYSLGVMWYQLLVADVSRELHPGWADELKEEYHALPSHIEAIRTCVGLFRKRPNDGSALLNLLNGLTEPPPVPIRQAPKSQPKPKEFAPPPPPPEDELEFVPPTPATPPPVPVTLPTPTAPKVEPPPILRVPTPTPVTPPPTPVRSLSDSKGKLSDSKAGKPKSKPEPEPVLEPLPATGVALEIKLPASSWVFADSEIIIHFDGIYLGSGSIKTGINLKANTTKGRHDLMCKVTVAGFPRQTDIPLNLAEEGFYEVNLVVNRMIGKFYLERVTKKT